MQFPHTDIYALTDSRLSLGRSTLEVARQMMLAGITILQYREKHKSPDEMLKECLALRILTQEAGCCFIINDHVDIALACNADGVHVGQDDMPATLVRQRIGAQRILGVSTRTMPEYETAIAEGANYIGAGPVFATSTKDAAPVTAHYLARLVAVSPIPVVAIGGINEATVAQVVHQGISCVAMVSAITLAPDIPAQVARLRQIMHCAASSR